MFTHLERLHALVRAADRRAHPLENGPRSVSVRPVAKYVDLASHYFIYLLCLELGRLAATTAAGAA